MDELAMTDQPTDFMSGFAFVLPMRVLCALFDLPDERRPPFYDWAASLRAAGDSMPAFGAAQAATGFAGSTTTTVDVELFGVVIPAGATVFASLDSAGRDEAHVTEPQKFDLRRGSASRHIAFGSGSRHCLGASLARTELQEGFGRLLRRFPDIRLAVDVDNVQMGRNITGGNFGLKFFFPERAVVLASGQQQPAPPPWQAVPAAEVGTARSQIRGRRPGRGGLGYGHASPQGFVTSRMTSPDVKLAALWRFITSASVAYHYERRPGER